MTYSRDHDRRNRAAADLALTEAAGWYELPDPEHARPPAHGARPDPATVDGAHAATDGPGPGLYEAGKAAAFDGFEEWQSEGRNQRDRAARDRLRRREE